MASDTEMLFFGDKRFWLRFRRMFMFLLLATISGHKDGTGRNAIYTYRR